MITIYVFSGTGNSRIIANVFVAAAEDMNHPVLLKELTCVESADETSGVKNISEDNPEQLIIVTPTHAFCAPWKLWRFVLGLPRGTGQFATTVFTRGSVPWKNSQTPGLAGTGPLLMTLLLLIRGYRPVPPISIDMPSNWTAVHTGIRQDKARKIIDRGIEKARVFFDETISGKGKWINRNSLWDLGFGLLLLPVTAGYLFIGRLLLAKIFFANNDCTQCGACVRNCPLGAVRMGRHDKSYPFWTHHCESCMRCMNSCPSKAIQVNLPWTIFLITMLSCIHFLVIKFFLSPPGSWILHILIAWIAIVSCYYVFHWSTRFRFMRKFLNFTAHTRFFRQYMAPPFSR